MDDASRVLALLKRYGWNATSFQVLEPDFRYWFDGDDACVAYVDTGSAWVAAGAPLAEEGRIAEVAGRFVDAARAARRRPVFFATERRFVEATRFESLPVGEQPVWDPARWPKAVQATPSLREQLRRARAKGVVVRVPAPEELADPAHPTRRAIDGLIARWLGSKPMAPMGFLVQVHPFSFPLERRYFVAERNGEVVGFLACVPVYARDGWFLEDLLRSPAAPNGTAETLVDAAMKAAVEQGAKYLTLGMVPLAGPVHGGLRIARQWTRGLYDFHGLRAFKAKLQPSRWDTVELSFPNGQNSAFALYDCLAAFARGGFLRFGIETLLRGPVVVVRLLATLLVPWTVMLALASAHWFPAAWVKWGWVGFDALLAPALFALGHRWRNRLATVLASLITADAALTAFEVAAWNVPRATTALDWVFSALAIAAPTLAAIVLWNGRAHRLRHG